ncbi:MAG TPA: TolC family protein, partial [Methylomirabilota bacterium]
MKRSAGGWIVSGVVAAALLGGCAIGPNYKRPVVAEPQTFRGQATAEAVSLADLPWWEVFQDTILKNLITEALGNNYDVKIAAARVQEARANFVVSRSDLYPSLDYGAGVSRSKIEPGVQGGPGGPAPSASNFYYGTVTMSWELDIWGRIRRSNEAARANLLATEDARRGVWLTLVSDLAQAYFELLALDVRLQIARDSTDAYQSTYNVFQDRLQVGVASKLETSRAEGAL